MSGMLSGGIAVCIGTPFDVALVRMQADSMKPLEARRNYKNVFDAIGRIFREEGAMRCGPAVRVPDPYATPWASCSW